MDRVIKVIHRAQRQERIINIVLGLLLLGMGTLIMFNKFTILTGFVSWLMPFKLPIGM